MNIFGILSLMGGLAMFLYGMTVMEDGLTKVSGGRLETILEKMTKSRFTGVLLGAGVTAVIQPGGSIRDAESIAAADEAGIAMIFTGRRHFKH